MSPNWAAGRGYVDPGSGGLCLSVVGVVHVFCFRAVLFVAIVPCQNVARAEAPAHFVSKTALPFGFW